MALLNYDVLAKSGYAGYVLPSAPEKVMQFGEGNFLRAFVDYFFDIANEKAGFNGKVVLVQPIASGLTDMINQQEGLYTLYLRGSEKGQKVDLKRVISSCSRGLNPYAPGGWQSVLDLAKSPDLEIIVSNTTEAGIVYEEGSKFEQTPPDSFPAKLTRVLYERWKAGLDGVVILSCELIDNNGKELLSCVNKYIALWGLEGAFKDWVNGKNIFCSTLVDRIVPGRIRNPEELAALNKANGYEDNLLDVGEVFGVWVIEGPAELESRLPFKKAGVPVHVVPDVTPYKKRKVRILNGAHTGFVPGAYLAGFDIVRDCMHNDTIRGFMNKMLYD
ncbi:MAG: tagaturonate reductase, partial [Synergistaceae bacterium]|nr:tagaturonate reductase [Synergistaceae bacterium]